jgi:hypothetical protein
MSNNFNYTNTFQHKQFDTYNETHTQNYTHTHTHTIRHTLLDTEM